MTLLPRAPMSDAHQIFRDAVRKFVAAEIAPHHAAWEEAGCVPRDLWRKAGQAGLLCTHLPEAWGGPGGDFLHAAIVLEELARVGASGPGFTVHSDICAPYILHQGTDAQKQRWLPELASGEAVAAIAMSEPDAGSDLAGIKTTATPDGEGWVIHGNKTFVTNGQLADLVIVVAKTDPEAGARGISLFLVPADSPGFSRGRNLHKVGLKAQDTSELFLDQVKVGPEALLGQRDHGFFYLMAELPQERLVIAITAVAAAEAAIAWTVDYTKERTAFGKPIARFQNTRFSIADLVADAAAGRALVDRCTALHLDGQLDAETAALAKLWTTEMQCRVVDRCLQLFGGYGYMWEYPIARAWADARVQTIYGGTSEIMKEIVSRRVFGGK